MLALYVVVVVTFLYGGLGDSSRLYLVAMIFTAAIFLGWWATVAAIILSLVTMSAGAWAFSTGRVTSYVDVVSSDLTAWLALTADVLGLGVFIALLVNFFMQRLNGYIERSRQLAGELEQHRFRLEEEVANRTSALERYSQRLELVTQIAREMAEIRDATRLLQDVARMISSRFGFYHVAIFLLDEVQEHLVLRAASLDGQEHPAVYGHRVPVGEGLIGRVAELGRPERVPDEMGELTFSSLPELPAARSEVALPIRVRGAVIGVLDIKAREPDAFLPDDVPVLQSLADQLGMAISNAELFQQVEEALEAERRAYGELSRKAWERLIRAQSQSQRYDPYGLLDSEEELGPPVSIPIKVRDQVIGRVRAYPAPQSRGLTREQKALLETLTEQLGVALEGARLYRDTQKRAAMEQLSAEIVARIRETLDMDTVMQTAVREMREALGLHDVLIRLEPTEKRDEEAVS
ncbi:MAG TPA: GAF domain-containing protein [Anaerolineae bacterium]|nr:GAF domain-containing protein [Anaerolineae bacterium]